MSYVKSMSDFQTRWLKVVQIKLNTSQLLSKTNLPECSGLCTGGFEGDGSLLPLSIFAMRTLRVAMINYPQILQPGKPSQFWKSKRCTNTNFGKSGSTGRSSFEWRQIVVVPRDSSAFSRLCETLQKQYWLLRETEMERVSFQHRVFRRVLRVSLCSRTEF